MIFGPRNPAKERQAISVSKLMFGKEESTLLTWMKNLIKVCGANLNYVFGAVGQPPETS